MHKNQKKILKLIGGGKKYTIREIQKKLKLSSPSLVQHHIRQLQKKDRLYKEKGVYKIKFFYLCKCGNHIEFHHNYCFECGKYVEKNNDNKIII